MILLLDDIELIIQTILNNLNEDIAVVSQSFRITKDVFRQVNNRLEDEKYHDMEVLITINSEIFKINNIYFLPILNSDKIRGFRKSNLIIINHKQIEKEKLENLIAGHFSFAKNKKRND